MQAADKKKIILGIFALVAVFVWMRGLKSSPRSSARSVMRAERVDSVSLDIQKRQKSQTAYDDWGRNPFAAARACEGGISGLCLDGIVYDEQGGYALINEQVISVGDEINGNRVVEVKEDKVILNDGTKDFELILQP